MFLGVVRQCLYELKGFFSLPRSIDWAGTQEAGREHSQGTWHKLAKGIFHTMWRQAQYGGSWLGVAIAAHSQAGHQTVGDEQLHCESPVLYILLSLLLLLLLLLLFLPLLFYWTVFISNHKFHLFSGCPPHPSGWEWASGCVVPSAG